MKKRLILMVLLVAVLVLGTVFAAYAKSGGRITGAMKAEYGTGWNWLQINVDASNPEDPSGFIKYKSWTEAPNEWGYWRAEPICVSFGEYMGSPAASIVSQFTESSEGWVGFYSKGIFVDGGTNAKYDQMGLDFDEFVVPEPPDCDFATPEDLYWSGVGGNITIHNP
jgi:hypothetical protein